MSEDFWVFGYGSLMWRPDFPHQEVRSARLDGYHRSFCVTSHFWRGTPERPGLVLGLNPGGSCRGVAFRVAAADRAGVIDALTERELGRYAYKAATLALETEGGMLSALVFVADPDHAHYAGELPLERAARMIMEAEGAAGLNRDYLINTIRELEKRGFGEPGLHELLRLVERLTGEIESGAGI